MSGTEPEPQRTGDEAQRRLLLVSARPIALAAALVFGGIGALVGSQFPEASVGNAKGWALGATVGIGCMLVAAVVAYVYASRVERDVRRGLRAGSEAGHARQLAERVADLSPDESKPQRKRRLRGTAQALGGCAVVASAAMGYSYVNEADLRGDDLRPATATVEGMEYRRRGADSLEVRFPADGETVRAEIPVTSEVEQTSGRVKVRYVPSDPTRVRTAQGWAPFYQGTGLLYVGVLAPAALFAFLLSLRNKGRDRSTVEQPASNDRAQ